MATPKEAAKEISILVPKLVTWTKSGYLASCNLTSSQIISLMSIHGFKKCSVSQLAKSLGVSLPTTSGIIDRLVKARYLKRLYDEKDRRIIFISLTNKGEEIVRKILENIKERWEEMLSYLTEEEIDSYVNILRKLTRITTEKNEA